MLVTCCETAAEDHNVSRDLSYSKKGSSPNSPLKNVTFFSAFGTTDGISFTSTVFGRQQKFLQQIKPKLYLQLNTKR